MMICRKSFSRKENPMFEFSWGVFWAIVAAMIVYHVCGLLVQGVIQIWGAMENGKAYDRRQVELGKMTPEEFALTPEFAAQQEANKNRDALRDARRAAIKRRDEEWANMTPQERESCKPDKFDFEKRGVRV
jgi:hypothetical protein